MGRIFETLSFYKGKEFCPSMKFNSGNSEFLFKKKKNGKSISESSAIEMREVRDEEEGTKS